MFTEDDLIQLSALQHYIFCPRQCALIHVEQVWAENRFTAEGKIMHERVHEEGRESRGDIRIEHGVPLRSLRLGLSGMADVIEFQRQPGGAAVHDCAHARAVRFAIRRQPKHRPQR